MRGATAAEAQRALADLVIGKTEGATALDPLTFSVSPWPIEWVAPFPSFPIARRSHQQRHVLSHVFRDDADMEAHLGMLAFPQPRAEAMLRDAGFSDVVFLDLEFDTFNYCAICRA